MKRLAETFLYHIWDAQHLSQNLKTIRGKSVQIEFHGRWNTNRGPDFKQAIISLDKNVFRGDVEIHYDTYDWINHGHHQDPHFNTVILHVVFQHTGKSSFTLKENGEEVEIFEMKSYLDHELSKLIDVYQDQEFVEKEHLCDFFSGLSQDQTMAALDFFGEKRFEQKRKRFAAESSYSSLNQTLYQGILESLGYAKNKFQMIELAQAIPYEKIQTWFQNGLDEQTLLSILIGSNELIEHIPRTVPTNWQQKWKELYANQSFFTDRIDLDWNFFRIRPVNHPLIRILQATRIIYPCLKTSLTQECVKLFSIPRNQFSISLFRQQYYPFIRREIPWLSEPIQIGKRRADTILINIILPIIHHFAQLKEYQELEKAINKIYQDFPGLPSNRVIKHMETGLEKFQKRMIQKKAKYQQGLQYIFSTYCQYRLCEACKKMREEIITNR